VSPGEAKQLLELSREVDLLGPRREEWTERLTPERERLAEAVRVLAGAGEEEAATELAANIWRVWFYSGDVAGGRELLAAALDAGDAQPSRARALALYADGLLAFRAGAQDDSSARNEAALEVARAVGDAEAESLALVGLSRVAFREGDYKRVRELATEALELTQDLDPAAGVMPLHLLAAGTRLDGEHDPAIDLYTESLELNRRLGNDRMVGVELHNIGHIEVHRGNLEAAERCFSECAALRSSDDPYDVAMGYLNQAALASERGETVRAADLLRQTESTLRDAGIVLDPDDAFEVDWLRERVSA
jgi:tetratricopeptide (TPR) repeat protein